MAARRILVTGGSGQIGLELRRLAWPDDCLAHFPAREELDLASAQSIADWVTPGRWDCVVNCAAWTAVDAAEDHVAEAFLVNAEGPRRLAEATRSAGIPIVQVSTDYVFAGTLDRPYREDDAAAPAGVYGASKLAGELAVLAANPRSVVLRTGWVLSAHRSNFLKTMLRLGAERKRLTVVADQIGCPTGAADVAEALRTISLRLIEDPAAPLGYFHFVNAGEASRHELACAIFAFAEAQGYPSPQVAAIATAEFPTRADRPANSRLDTTRLASAYGITPRHWHEAVRDIVRDVLPHEETGSVA